jgi:Fic family protein
LTKKIFIAKIINNFNIQNGFFMSSKFNPTFAVSILIAKSLMRIEAAKERSNNFSITAKLLSSLRESAKLYTTHYSTMIEGNRLSIEEAKKVIMQKGHFPGRERDEEEIIGYYSGLDKLEQCVKLKQLISENIIQTLHALVIGKGKSKVTPTAYRDGQNVIKDSMTGSIVYLPPEAQDVKNLMDELIFWIPLVAAIAHYQFATIHPYYDGNGRTARLLTTLILHLNGYGLKGLYSLEEYYAKNLPAYYQAISVGPSHNYYFGREESDITSWIEYFLIGMAFAFEKVAEQMSKINHKDNKIQSELMKCLDQRQKKSLILFQNYNEITSGQVSQLFGCKKSNGSMICKKWVEVGFLEIVDHSNKNRKYKLSNKFKDLIQTL